MNWRGTLGLFVALAALAGAYVYLQWRGETEVRRVEEAKRLFDFEPAAISRLEIQQVDQKNVVGTRGEDGLWKISEPNPTIPAFAPLWDRVSEHLAGLMNERTLELGELKLSDFGLDIPVLRVRAQAGDRSIELLFGKLEPTQEKRYALLNGKLLFLAHKNPFFELNRSLDDLRNKFTVDDREANIVRLEFSQIWTGREQTEMPNPPMVGEESPPIITARDNAGEPWKLVAPRQAAANQELVEALVKEIQFAVGRRFVDHVESLSDYGLQPARMRITLVDDRSNSPQTFLLGSTDPESGGIWVQRPGRDGVFMIDPQLLTLLPKSPDAFQERRLLTRQALDMNRIVITHLGTVCELNDVPDKGWVASPASTFETDQAAVSAYITALKRAQGESILLTEPAAVGLAEPETLIQLYPRDGGAPSEIRVQSKWEDPEKAVAQQDLGAIMTVSQEAAAALQVDPQYFRSRKIWKLNPAEVQELTLSLEGTAYTFKKAHGVWAVTAPENLLVGDGAAVDNLLKTFAELRVVSPRPEEGIADDVLGFAAPVLQASFVTQAEGADPSTVGPLEVGASSAEKMLHRYTRLAGLEGVYRVEQKLVDAVRDFVGALQTK